MKFIPKYITTDILAEYGEHLTHEAYNEMVKLNSTQGDYNTEILNQLFNTAEGIQIPYLDNKIKEVTDAQTIINEDMDQVVEDMKALAGSLSKYTTICETRKMIQNATQGFVKTNKIKAGENIDVSVDALNNVTISAHIDLDDYATNSYVDTKTQEAKEYTDTQISNIPVIDLSGYTTKEYVDRQDTNTLNSITYLLGDYTSKAYVDTQDTNTLSSANRYADNAISQINLSIYATKEYVNNAISQIDLSSYATKEYVDGLMGSVNTELENIINGG